MILGRPSILPSLHLCDMCVHPKSTVFIYKLLGQFQQIYSFDSLGDKYELISFSGQKVKGQGREHVKYCQKRGDICITYALIAPHQ